TSSTCFFPKRIVSASPIPLVLRRFPGDVNRHLTCHPFRKRPGPFHLLDLYSSEPAPNADSPVGVGPLSCRIRLYRSHPVDRRLPADPKQADERKYSPGHRRAAFHFALCNCSSAGRQETEPQLFLSLQLECLADYAATHWLHQFLGSAAAAQRKYI